MPVFRIRLIVLVLLLSPGFSVVAQSRFKSYLKEAWSSSENGQHVAALMLLYKAQALKGTDTGYNESVNLYIGDNYLAIGKIDSCIRYFDNSINFYEVQKDSAMLDYIYSRMGRVELGFTKRYDKALIYFNRQLPYTMRQQDSSSYFHCLNNMGITYKYLTKYDSALCYFRKVEANNAVYNTAKNAALRLAADTYSLLRQYGKALSYYNRAITALMFDHDELNLFTAFLNKGDCLMQQGRFKESLDCFERAGRYQEAVTNNEKKILYENFAYVFSKTGDFTKAFYFKNLEVGIKDSINTHSIEQAAAEMEAKYEVRKNKDSLNISSQNLRLANKESEDRQRKFVMALIATAAIALLFFLALRNAAIRKKANEKLAIQKAKVEALAGELEEANQTKARLFSVISHDLRSPVSSLYALLKVQELKAGSSSTSADAVSNQMMHLLDTLEDLLTWSKSQMDKFKLQPVAIQVNTVYNEMIDLYRDIAEGKQIAIVNKAPAQLKMYTDENLLKTILRNMLSNSFHYAPGHSTVILDAAEQDIHIVCTISNEATATEYAVLESKLNNTTVESSKHGLGTVLVKEFIQKLHTNLQLSYANGRVYLQFSLPAYVK